MRRTDNINANIFTRIMPSFHNNIIVPIKIMLKPPVYEWRVSNMCEIPIKIIITGHYCEAAARKFIILN